MYLTRLAAQVIIRHTRMQDVILQLESRQSRKRKRGGRGREGRRLGVGVQQRNAKLCCAKEGNAARVTASFHLIESLRRSRHKREKKWKTAYRGWETLDCKTCLNQLWLCSPLTVGPEWWDWKKEKEKGKKTHYQNMKTCYTKNSIVASKIIWPASR